MIPPSSRPKSKASNPFSPKTKNQPSTTNVFHEQFSNSCLITSYLVWILFSSDQKKFFRIKSNSFVVAGK